MSGTALYDSDGNFIGHSIGVQHHTAGTRAWCLEGMMSEWCYPSSPCDSCQRARMGDPWEAIQRVRELCEQASTVIARGCTCYGNDCTGCRRGEPMGWDLDPAQVLAALDGESDG